MGVTFTWLASEHFLKVRGNTRLQVEFFKKSDLQIPWPHPPALQTLHEPHRSAQWQEAWPCSHPCGAWCPRNVRAQQPWDI